MNPIHTEAAAASVSVPLTIVAFCANGLPVVQFIAAVVAIVAGTITIVAWVKRRI